jgi:hypothetical protein
MSTFFGSMLVCLISGAFASCSLAAIRAILPKGKPSQDEEAGAPEGAFHFAFQHPNASGSNRGVRVISKSPSSMGEG